jgi:hypothetical protein
VTATQWAEFAGLGFALAVLAWVIYRLTGTLRDLVLKRRDEEEER